MAERSQKAVRLARRIVFVLGLSILLACFGIMATFTVLWLLHVPVERYVFVLVKGVGGVGGLIGAALCLIGDES
jgi:hypothetical protein